MAADPDEVSMERSARYVAEHMRDAYDLHTREQLLDFALSQCELLGLVLEFGVYRGKTLDRIADRSPCIVHGFDSFEGLPDDWTDDRSKGRFSLGGQLPSLKARNVVLHKGWFAETLPPFLAEHREPVRFAHVDCDVYSSAKTVLTHLEPRLYPGSILVFDEYFDYAGWEEHEHRALRETAESAGLRYRYIGYASEWGAAAVRVEGRRA